MDYFLDSPRDLKVFTTRDKKGGYWKIQGIGEDQDKKFFKPHTGTYLYKRMPFGLSNAPSSFQWVLDIILSGAS